MISWLNVQEAAGMLTAMGLVFAGLWYGFPGPVFRFLMRRVARTRGSGG
jgi:hypothetical protein